MKKNFNMSGQPIENEKPVAKLLAAVLVERTC